MSGHPSGVLAAYRHVDAAVDALRELKEMGYKDFTVYTPVPNQEIADTVGHKISPVRLWTLFGGLAGATTGFVMTLWMSYDWPIVVGGKPIGSVIPYVVFSFELTVLFGAISTLIGLAIHSWGTARPAAFDGRFTDDLIGIFVECPDDRQPSVEELLRKSGAEEVRVEA
jgi:hypothetical protein